MNDDDEEFASGPPQLDGMTLDEIHERFRVGTIREPIDRLKEAESYWSFGSPSPVRFDRRRPAFSYGFGAQLDPRATLLKRRFDFPDLNRTGWAIIFQNSPPPGEQCEWFLGWVPPEREGEADTWIAHLNAEIAARFREAAARAKP